MMAWICFRLWILIADLCYTLAPQEPQSLHLEGRLTSHSTVTETIKLKHRALGAGTPGVQRGLHTFLFSPLTDTRGLSVRSAALPPHLSRALRTLAGIRGILQGPLK